VICCDGTWNKPNQNVNEDNVSNVLRTGRRILAQKETTQQQVFYDWGLGSYHDSIVAGITGRGIEKNICDAYRYLVHNYHPATKIFLFGFSRGAYTVRALCGMINNIGVLTRDNAHRIPTAWQIYKSNARKNHPKGINAQRFSNNFCHADVAIQFVGVWDTVGALGIPFSLMGIFESTDEFYDTKLGSNVKVARHALAIDETRQDFEPTLWMPTPGIDIKQVWFAGSHSDVGGGYPADQKGLTLSELPLHWMLTEAEQYGLMLTKNSTPRSDIHLARINPSRKHVFRIKKPLYRVLDPVGYGLKIHRSVKQKYEADDSYRPKNLLNLLRGKTWQDIIIED
jgi:uncharacterized protein (DUF2235 family)